MHHVVTAAFVASPLLVGRGGIAICFGLFTGEVTNGEWFRCAHLLAPGLARSALRPARVRPYLVHPPHTGPPNNRSNALAFPHAGLFHSYLILEQFAKVSPRAATAFRWVAAVFTTVFVIVRRWAAGGVREEAGVGAQPLLVVAAAAISSSPAPQLKLIAFLASTRHTNPQHHVLASNLLVLAQSLGGCFRALPPPPAVVHHRAAGGAGVSRLCHQLCHFYHQAVEGACGAAAAAAAAQGGVKDALAASGPVDAFCRLLFDAPPFCAARCFYFLHLSYVLTAQRKLNCCQQSPPPFKLMLAAERAARGQRSAAVGASYGAWCSCRRHQPRDQTCISPSKPSGRQ